MLSILVFCAKLFAMHIPFRAFLIGFGVALSSLSHAQDNLDNCKYYCADQWDQSRCTHELNVLISELQLVSADIVSSIRSKMDFEEYCKNPSSSAYIYKPKWELFLACKRPDSEFEPSKIALINYHAKKNSPEAILEKFKTKAADYQFDFQLNCPAIYKIFNTK